MPIKIIQKWSLGYVESGSVITFHGYVSPNFLSMLTYHIRICVDGGDALKKKASVVQQPAACGTSSILINAVKEQEETVREEYEIEIQLSLTQPQPDIQTLGLNDQFTMISITDLRDG